MAELDRPYDFLSVCHCKFVSRPTDLSFTSFELLDVEEYHDLEI